jgi:hypothetical protein
MNLTILGYTLGTLPAWLPIWAVPAAMVHAALFLALIVPAWVGLARARAGGPLSLVLVLPILGLLMLTPIYMNRVLPYAHWGRFWGILVLIPGLNIFFLWIFAFAPWKRRYIPLDQEEYSETTGLPSRTGRSEPRLEGKSREPASEKAAETLGPGAEESARGDAPPRRAGAQKAALSPMSGEPGTMMAGAAGPVPSKPGKSETSTPTGVPAASPAATMLAGREKPQPLDEPVAPTPPIPARSLQPPPEPPKPPPAPPPAPPRAAPPPAPEPEPPPAPAPPRRRPERTQDVTGRPPVPPEPGEAATMRVATPPRQGGRAWRLVGANDLAAAFDFTVQEPALLETDSGLLIGRSARANFVIEHDSVSRNHARFLLERGELCLEDLDSMNGTWVDGQKLEPNAPVPLQPGGIVEIGKIKLRVTGG